MARSAFLLLAIAAAAAVASFVSAQTVPPPSKAPPNATTPPPATAPTGAAGTPPLSPPAGNYTPKNVTLKDVVAIETNITKHCNIPDIYVRRPADCCAPPAGRLCPCGAVHALWPSGPLIASVAPLHAMGHIITRVGHTQRAEIAVHHLVWYISEQASPHSYPMDVHNAWVALKVAQMKVRSVSLWPVAAPRRCSGFAPTYRCCCQRLPPA